MIPEVFVQFVRGFCMGAADIVPGVSGGTVALVFGIYRRLIANVGKGSDTLKLALSGRFADAWKAFTGIEWLFLVPLGAGVIGAFALLRHPLGDLMVERPSELAAVFCGLVAASIAIVWRQMTAPVSVSTPIVAGVGLVMFVLLGFQAGAVANPPIWAFAAAAAVAICAMILPGISGSFILLMMGMYGAVLEASLAQLAVFGVGAVIGLALFSSLLNWLLAHHEQTVLAVLVGLMIGSFRVLWPWPNGVGYEDPVTEVEVPGTGLELPANLGDGLVALGLAAAAAVATFAIVRVAEDRSVGH